VLQLVGNLLLLAPLAVLAVLRRPRLGTAAGTGIELLQWALPLGRVVPPVDAALNAVGAVAVGLAVALAAGGPAQRPVPRLSRREVEPRSA
jgi:hypothetical protein